MSMRQLVIDKIVDLAMAQNRDRGFDVTWNDGFAGALEQYKKKAADYEAGLQSRSDDELLDQLLGMKEISS